MGRDGVVDDGCDAIGSTHEEVIGAGHGDHRGVGPVGGAFDGGGRIPELIVFGHDEDLRTGIGSGGVAEFVDGKDAQWGCAGDPRGDALVEHRERGVTTERPSRDEEGKGGARRRQGLDGRDDVEGFAPTEVVLTLRPTDTPEVEAQHSEATAGQRPEEFARDQ